MKGLFIWVLIPVVVFISYFLGTRRWGVEGVISVNPVVPLGDPSNRENFDDMSKEVLLPVSSNTTSCGCSGVAQRPVDLVPDVPLNGNRLDLVKLKEVYLTSPESKKMSFNQFVEKR